MVFNLDDSYKAKYLQTIIVNDSIIDFAIAADNKTIITSLESEQHSIKYFTLQEEMMGRNFLKFKDQILNNSSQLKLNKTGFSTIIYHFPIKKRSDS